MAKNSPDNIPAQFTESANLANAYRRGWNHGHGVACHNIPTLGETLFIDGEGRVTIDAANIREMHETITHAGADNSRQYSPFEFTAHEFNKYHEAGYKISYDQDDVSEDTYDTREEAEAKAIEEGRAAEDVIRVTDSESLWEAFEAGTGDAIAADLEGYTDEDYGIEEEAEPEDDEII